MAFIHVLGARMGVEKGFEQRIDLTWRLERRSEGT